MSDSPYFVLHSLSLAQFSSTNNNINAEAREEEEKQQEYDNMLTKGGRTA